MPTKNKRISIALNSNELKRFELIKELMNTKNNATVLIRLIYFYFDWLSLINK